jgi:hypothetical protein
VIVQNDVFGRRFPDPEQFHAVLENRCFWLDIALLGPREIIRFRGTKEAPMSSGAGQKIYREAEVINVYGVEDLLHLSGR